MYSKNEISDSYRLGRYSDGNLNDWIEIIGNSDQPLKKRLSAVAGLAGVLHSTKQSEKSKRDAFCIMMELIDKQTQLDIIFSTSALEYLAEFLLLNADGGGCGIDTGDVMPSSYHYLDDNLVLSCGNYRILIIWRVYLMEPKFYYSQFLAIRNHIRVYGSPLKCHTILNQNYRFFRKILPIFA